MNVTGSPCVTVLLVAFEVTAVPSGVSSYVSIIIIKEMKSLQKIPTLSLINFLLDRCCGSILSLVQNFISLCFKLVIMHSHILPCPNTKENKIGTKNKIEPQH